MKKIIIDEPTGSAYWLEGESLYSAPLNADGSVAIEEGGEVEVFDEINKESIRARLV